MRGSILPHAPTNSNRQKTVDLRKPEKTRNIGFFKFLIENSAKSCVFGSHALPSSSRALCFLYPTNSEVPISIYRIQKREKIKIKINFFTSQDPSLSLSRHLPFSFVMFLFYFILFEVGSTRPLFFHFLVRFSSETNYFVPVSISFIIIEYSLNIYYFSRFFSNLVFRFHSTPIA